SLVRALRCGTTTDGFKLCRRPGGKAPTPHNHAAHSSHTTAYGGTTSDIADARSVRSSVARVSTNTLRKTRRILFRLTCSYSSRLVMFSTEWSTPRNGFPSLIKPDMTQI